MFIKLFKQFLNAYGKGYGVKLFLIGVLSVIMGCFEFFGLVLIFPFVMLLAGDSSFLNFPRVKLFLDGISSAYEIKSIALILCFLIIIIYVIKDVFMIYCTRFQNNVIANWQFDIYSKTIKELINCPYLKINKLSFGSKSTLVGGALASALWGFIHKVILLLSNCIIALGILTFLFHKFPLPALFTAIFLGIFTYLEQLFFKRRAKYLGAKLLEVSKRLGSLFEYTMKGIKEIKVSKNRGFFIQNLLDTYKESNKYSKLLNSNGAYPVYVTEIGMIVSFGILAALIFILQKNSSGFMVSSLAVVAAVVLRLVPILNKIQASMFSINQSRNYTTWFLKTTDSIRKWTQSENDYPKIDFKNSIRLKNVNFTYNDEENCSKEAFSLKNINLEIKKGKFIGIVGKSGSGKTTLMDILTGLYRPDSGSFLVDNTEITKDNVRGFQKCISILPQEFFLMPVSIMENITFGENKKDIDIEKVNEALKKAELFDKIKDLDKEAELSHGQKHRLALARALYQDADILFLDEATSSLDLETEDKVSKTIAKLKGEKTIIAIAHRLSTLKECDALIYMKDGKIIDEGTFKELKEKYADFENLLELSTFNIA